MWNNTISFYIFLKEIGKIRLELSHKAKKQTLCENPTLNAIQSLSRSKNKKFKLKYSSKMFIFCFPFKVVYLY
jgi:hypothetical protein